jgi:hypothetical protein
MSSAAANASTLAGARDRAPRRRTVPEAKGSDIGDSKVISSYIHVIAYNIYAGQRSWDHRWGANPPPCTVAR